MESKAKILGHPLHPMLVAFPLGLLSSSLVFDIIHLVSNHQRWGEVAYLTLCAGLITGVVAAIPGLIDAISIPENTRAKYIGYLHGIGNAIVLSVFALSLILRKFMPEFGPIAPLALSAVGVGGALVTGWLGGELVDRLGVGVSDGAHLNATNSLQRKRPSQSGMAHQTH